MALLSQAKGGAGRKRISSPCRWSCRYPNCCIAFHRSWCNARSTTSVQYSRYVVRKRSEAREVRREGVIQKTAEG